MQVQIRREQMRRLSGEKELHQLQVKQRLMLMQKPPQTFSNLLKRHQDNFSVIYFSLHASALALFMCDIQHKPRL